MATDDDATTDPADEDEDEDAQENACDYIDSESNARLWLRTLLPVASMKTPESDDPARKAVALARAAACDRIVRICRSDLAAGETG